MGTPIQSGSSGAVEIHFSRVFGGRTPTLCGRRDVPRPATDEWWSVTCRRCLELGAATSPDARAALARRDAEATARHRKTSPAASVTEAEIRRLSGADDPVFHTWLADLHDGRLRAGREIRARMAAGR